MKNIEISKMFMKKDKTQYVVFLALILEGVTWFYYDFKVAIIHAVFIILVLTYYLILKKNYAKRLIAIIEKNQLKFSKIKKDANFNTPIPYIVLDIEGDIQWVSKKFNLIMDGIEKNKNMNIINLIPTFHKDYLIGKEPKRIIEFNDKIYVIHKEIIKYEKAKEDEYLVVLYFEECTKFYELQKKYYARESVLGYVYVDNYHEVMDSIREIARPMLSGAIEEKIKYIGNEFNSIVKKIDKDQYIIIIQKEELDKLKETKFEILDSVRNINIGNELPPTLSIGFGYTEMSLVKSLECAKDAVELAVGRGGDQAILKVGQEYEYYGGKTRKDVENNNKSKARARIKAHAFKDILKDIDNVLIMGHKNPDLDCLGAAVGMYRAVDVLGKKAHIVLDEVTTGIESLYERIIESNEFEEDYFINSAKALELLEQKTLLVVVDVNQPNYVESKEVLDEANRVVVIDHHIKSSQSIDKAELTFLEAYASSTCELITQLIQYIDNKIDIKEIEADAMLAGIVVDTKNFIFKTGVKTFEAAAYLRRNGADNTRVKILFQNDFKTYKIRAAAIESAEIYKDKYALAICPSNVIKPYVIISQIADELLSVSGVKASFVIVKGKKEEILISARSLGDVNIELLAEKFGGGGHFTAAGAQIHDSNLVEVITMIKEYIDELFEEDTAI